jgi:hypothetical protein
MRLILLVPVWLALTTGEPELLHSCPMHHAAAQVNAHSHAGHAPAAPAHGSHKVCSCVGPCSITIAWAPRPTAVSVAAVVTDSHVAQPNAAIRHAARNAERLLPFANGPPTQRS